ncbi:hypothetical protein LTR53_015028 [Teratosphaeriaceae sp. CCFEE 6253]|nr:hypothetical protein LTR53_015028 [Teratosphaeriaceae sp. CCFEE 6253]
MADPDLKDPHDAPPSTPGSPPDASGAAGAGKDKRCPFCGQAFTSSSLGRHLDLYIKPRNPKPADGVHDVDEIRRLRGSITRRQPKTSLKPGANLNVSGWRSESMESTPNTGSASRAATTKVEARVMEESPVASPVMFREGDNVQTSFNTANWQATGVINNLPPRAPSRSHAATPTGQAQRIEAMRRDATGHKIERPEYEGEDVSKLREDAEVGRAAELALREVLGSLEAAQRKVEPQELFPGVDFFSLTFPGLILAILPAPSTLFSVTPFAGAETWSLSPPGPQQYDALNTLFTHAYKKRIAEGLLDSVAFKYGAHSSGAYEHWERMSEPDKARAWNLELCRSLVKAQQEKRAVRDQLEAAQTRIRHLEAEYDRLSRCQLPREFLLHPASTLPAPAALVKELNGAQHMTTAAEASYDADALITKWRATVKATTRRPPAAAAAPPQVDQQQGYLPRPLQSDIILTGAVLGVNGAMPRTADATRGQGQAVAGVEYETPPNPGAIVSVEEEGVAEEDDDADGEVEDGGGGGRDGGGHGDYAAGRGALMRQTRAGAGSGVGEPLQRVPMQPWGINSNGKRPHAPTSASGRAGGPKMYREQQPLRSSERGRERRELMER